MDEVRKRKIIGKMYSKLLCTKEEYETGNVSDERIEMFVKGIALLQGEFTVKGQIVAYQKAIFSIENDKSGDMSESQLKGLKTSHLSMMKKLIQIQDKMKVSEPVKVSQKQMDFKSYHDTTNANENDLEVFTTKAVLQDDVIIEMFTKHKKLTASEAFGMFPDKNAPLTSIRRSISNMVRKGFLEKLDGKNPEKKMGLYGREEYVYEIRH